ncbi:hypothetical protein PCANC_25504 [Puccinia coronata f. sp. avenae]|uniref:No apical meristem-associated C-terminal domain-containing protein n=1 Tax=Puccinia coronata f. sp. avenae TaxID=200324 RepID=A0A2N5U9B6_9BASI|nr:hypothetical protein PCANC_25504 [Puccinia coronata f. sp. avenae]
MPCGCTSATSLPPSSLPKNTSTLHSLISIPPPKLPTTKSSPHHNIKMPSTKQINSSPTPTQEKKTKKTNAWSIDNDDEKQLQPSKKTKKAPGTSKKSSELESGNNLDSDTSKNDIKEAKETIDFDGKSTKKSIKTKKAPTKKKKNDSEIELDGGEHNNPPTTCHPNFNEDKDVQICCSWLEVTDNPLNSTNQTSTTFWARVCEHYLIRIPMYQHPISSIKTCWQVLQRYINKFHGCLKQVKQANQSGLTQKDQLNRALELCAALEGRLFNNLCCYNILNEAEKWNSYFSDLELKRSMLPSSSIELSSKISHSEAPSNITVVQSTKPGETSRPIGNK